MNEPEKLKILLLGDYSNFHATLARGLRALGQDVTLASDGGSFMQCERDLDISRRFSGKAGGLLHASALMLTTLTRLRGFDIVSFRDPQFLQLRPEKIKWFLKAITANNGACFHSYLSTDVRFLDMLKAPDSPLRYSEWFVDGQPNRLRIKESDKWEAWHSPEMISLNDAFYSRMRGAVTALYEYHKAAERSYPAGSIAYGGIPIDTGAIEPMVIDRPGKVRLFLAWDYKRRLEKGNDLLEQAARNVVARHPDKAEVVMVENVTRSQYLDAMRSCHVLLDQIYSYTPATMALESMAAGLTVVSGAEKDFYDFIGEKENFPIVNAPLGLEEIERTIEDIVTHRERFAERSRRGRSFVEKHNAMEVVAGRFLNFWRSHA